MKTIWKYELKTADAQSVEMPAGAEVLTVQTQFSFPCLWAMVDPIVKKEPRIIQTFGTGHSIEDGDIQRRYVGTYQLNNGGLVFHVFEVLNK